jgi:hypothetical protein
MGKIGAFSGGYALTAMQDLYHANDANPTHDQLVKAGQLPFWVASSLAIIAALLAWFGLPEVGQDTIDYEDVRFRAYLVSHGYDVTQMGLEASSSTETIVTEDGKPIA